MEMCHHFLSRRFVAPVGGRDGGGGGGVLEVEDVLFHWRLDANAADCFVIRSLIATSIIT